ncbi:MAG: adenylate/guanylate cyclase domain-containing protein, partial [Nitrospirae bacterium]|nr:adenylate/guanylate cyclase domain-containing protein [Nitrospirota bacterium]
KTYDLRLHLKDFLGEQPMVDDIIIVLIDEKSIKKIGRWPWKRDVMAALVNNISKERPKVIGIDIMFSEKEGAKTDGRLAKAIKKAGNVVLATAFILPVEGKKGAVSDGPPDFLWSSAYMEVKSVMDIPWKEWSTKAEFVNPPIRGFSESASLGHVNMHLDMDGVLRWEIMYLNYADDWYPPFSLQIARIALGIEMNEMALYGGSSIKIGNQFIYTDLRGMTLINYRSRNNPFQALSASDVIKGKAAKGIFKDKIVLIGASALGTYDQKITPISADMPGVEKNANVVENILLNNFNRKSPGIVELAVIIFTGISLGLLLPKLRAMSSVLLAVSFMAIYILMGCYLLLYKSLWINFVYPLSNIFVIFMAQTAIRFSREERKAKEVREMFSSYVSPKIVEELINHPEKAKLGGDRKTVTILFSDLIGFTSLSEKLPPEEVVAILNEYLKEMTDIIFRWDGTLDKFVGDEIVAFWGAPLEQENHAELAIRCALHMSSKLNKMQEEWRASGKSILDCGMGINTGEVLIGNIGAQGKKMDYTMIGDHVNLTARVEKLTREYHTRVLITEDTVRNIEALIKKGCFGHFELKEFPPVKVKGKEREVKVFGLMGGEH